MNSLNQQERDWLTYYQSVPYNQLDQKHRDYYGYLMQKVRVPESIEKGSSHPTKTMKKPKGGKAVKSKKNNTLTALVFTAGFLLIVCAILFIKQDLEKGLEKPKPKPVTNSVTFHK